MAKYKIDGVLYNIDDNLDINQTVAEIRMSKSHFEASTKATTKGAGEAIAENTAGAITAAGDLIAGLPGFVGALPYGAIEAARTGSFTKGKEAVGEISDEMNPLSTNFRWGPLPKIEELEPSRQTGGYKNIMAVPEAILDAPGKYTGAIAYYSGADPETIEQVGAGTDLLTMGLAGVGLVRGGVKSGKKARSGLQERKRAEAKARLEQEMADREAERLKAPSDEAYMSDVADAGLPRPAPGAEGILRRIETDEALAAIEGNMMRYPKDMQAPQLGMGGRMAKIPDQVGVERGKTYGTDAFETMKADMAALAEEQGKPIGVDFEREPGTGIYQIERSPERPTMRPEALQGPDRPTQVPPQGGIPYERSTAGLDRLIADKEAGDRKAAEVDRAYEQRDAQQKMEAAATGREAGQLPVWEQLERDLSSPRGPRRTGPLGGVGKRGFGQGGAINLFGEPKKPTFEDFKQEAKSLGYDNVPERILREVWEKRQRKSEPVVTDPKQKILEGISKELAESTVDLYANDLDVPGIAKVLTEYAEQGGKDAKAGKLLPGGYTMTRHPLHRWLNSVINTTIESAQKAGEAIRIGTQIVRGRRVVDKDSPQGRWDALERKQKVDVNRVGNYLTDKDLAPTPENIRAALGRDLLPAEQRALEGIAKIGEWVLGVLNEARVYRGLDAIPGRNFYWTPALWKGDYRYFLKDPVSGEVIHTFGTYYRPNSYLGRVFNRELNKALKEHGLEVNVNDFVRQLTPEDLSLSGIEVLLEHQGRSKSARAQAVRETVEKVLSDFEFKRGRGLERKGIPGYLGSEGGMQGVRNFEKVLNRMVESTAHIKANLELAKLYKDMMSPENIQAFEKFPNALKTSLKRLDTVMGKNSFEVLDKFVADLLDEAGLPPSLVAGVISKSGNASTRLLLGVYHATQMIVQVFQPLYMIPKTQQLMSRHGMNPAMAQYIVAKSIVKSLIDQIARPEYFNKLAEEGAFTPTLQLEYSGFGSSRLPSKALDFALNLDKNILSGIEQYVVRRPAAAMAYHAMKEAGFEGQTLHRIVKGLTDDYMVSFSRHKKSGIFTTTGMVGDMLGRLQSFPLTWVAQFLEYSRNVFTKGEITPFATFVGINMLVSGLTGLVGIKDADSLISWINTVFKTEIPTASEAILRNTKSDTMRYGAVSAATGMNFGASMAAPTATGTQFAPAVQLWQSILRTIVVGMEHAFADETRKPTREETREALRGMVPRSMHKYLEEPGFWGDMLGTSRLTPNLLNSKGQAIIERNDKDKLARGLGTFSLREAETKRIDSIARQKEITQRQHRSDFYERYVQHFLRGEKFGPAWMKRAEELELSEANLRSGLREHLERKYLMGDQRAIKRMTTAQQQRIYLLYQALRGEQTR